MSFLDYLRFYGPILMVAFYLLVCGQRVKATTEFFALATLMLFGVNRLMSKIMQPHWIFQALAAMIGWFALVRLGATSNFVDAGTRRRSRGTW